MTLDTYGFIAVVYSHLFCVFGAGLALVRYAQGTWPIEALFAGIAMLGVMLAIDIYLCFALRKRSRDGGNMVFPGG